MSFTESRIVTGVHGSLRTTATNKNDSAGTTAARATDEKHERAVKNVNRVPILRGCVENEKAVVATTRKTSLSIAVNVETDLGKHKARRNNW